MAERKHFDPTRTEWVVPNGPVRCIRLRDAFMGAATYVTQTPGGLFVNGDAAPGPESRGCGTFDAKTLEWLRTARGDYLVGRFLVKTWDAERFVAVVEERLEEADDYGLDADKLSEIIAEGYDYWHESGMSSAHDAWTEAGGESEDFPGMGYDEKSASLLAEIAECVAWLFDREVPHV